MLTMMLLIAGSATSPDPIDPALREEVAAMVQVDQEARMAMLAAFGEGAKTALQAAKVLAIDEANTAHMERVIASHGWPGRALIGESGSHDAWLLIQHADRHLAFQKRCLTLLEDAVARGDADGRDLAYLVDRVLVAEGKPQRYGTQFRGSGPALAPSPIEDEAHVDERRKAVGLNSMVEYAEQIREMYRQGPAARSK